MKWLVRVCGIAVLVLMAAAIAWVQRGETTQDSSSVVTRMREVARLETLDVSVYKKVSFVPEPLPSSSMWGELFQFAKDSIAPTQGRAIVFADAHFGLDVSKLDSDHVRIRGDRIEVVLPPVLVAVELKPAETEIIGSNLDSAQTAALFARAKQLLENDVRADRALRERARSSAERSLKALLLTLGFHEIVFVDTAPGLRAS